MNNQTQKTMEKTKNKVEKKDLSAQVLSKINTFQHAGELRIPKDYSPENALKSAYLILEETKNRSGQKALEYCTKESIGQALLKMVVWGLSPLKKQCDFIMYNDRLECGIEYTGNIVLAKRYGGLKEIKAHAIFEADEFDFEIDVNTGRTKILKHKPSLKSYGSKNISGAYAVMEMMDGTFDAEVMSIEMIRQAWGQGATNGASPAHKNFPDQMAKKTVINRACKLLIRGSDDAVLYDTEEYSYIDVTAQEVEGEINKNANKESLQINIEDAKEDDSKSQKRRKEEIDAENERLYHEALQEEQGKDNTKPGF